ncbi:MAG: hypothetical protein IJU33_04850 [Bacteroidales bacterium]|nr:hypothetical protein [Bacteroidales bacterium]
MLVTTVLLTGCERLNVRYYIRYEVDVNTNYTGDISFITVNTEYGAQSFNTGKYFSETFGPVTPNFVAKVIAYTSAYQADVNVRIYACRGEESFVLKRTATFKGPTDRYPGILEYAIDF